MRVKRSPKKKMVAANWKMNLTHKEVKPYLDSFPAKVGEINQPILERVTFVFAVC